MAGEVISSVVSLQHQLLVHSPLALFLLCPLLILVGAALPPHRGWPYRLAALLVLALGTFSLFFAIPVPGHVDPAVARTPAAGAVQWIFRSLIIESRIIFVGLTMIYIAVILLPEILRLRDNRLFSTVLPLSFLVLYPAGAVFLMQTTDSAAAVTWKLGIDASGAAPSNGCQAVHRERK